jgi:hypothetical protein
MLVRMTLGATGVGNLVDHRRRPGSMALIAAQPDVLSFQREAGCPMPGHVESGRLESVYLVTGGTLSSISPTGKLVFVRALPVTIATEVMGHRLLEIALHVARLARQPGMLPGEREPAARMVEHCRRCGGFPGRQGVTRFAACLKCPVVRIIVARGAIRECQIAEFDEGLAAGGCHLRVTLAAFNLFVRPGESETGLGVIILHGVLPTDGVMAGLALCRQLCPVRVCVAAQAVASEPQECAAAIFWHHAFVIGRRNMRGLMALTAGKRSMASGQRVAGPSVVKILLGGIPLNQFEIAAIVFEVAHTARLPVRFRTDQSRMQAAPGLQLPPDLPMACQTLPVRLLRSDLVTVDAVFRTIKRAVGPG